MFFKYVQFYCVFFKLTANGPALDELHTLVQINYYQS